jgi:nicotinamidase-related amidase
MGQQQNADRGSPVPERVETPMTTETFNDIEARLAAVLEEAFEAGTDIYNERGFKRRIGYGNRPAVIHIDLANAWTRPGHPFSCPGMEEIIPNVQRINEAARAKGVPVFYTTNVYRNRDATSGTNDMGLWYSKIPTETLPADSYWAQIDDRIAPAEGEVVIEKNRASAFPGTNLELFLTSNRIDTLIVTGATAAGCVRHTVEDAIAKGFRPIIPRETIGDRVPGVVQWNLYDIDNKFGDVESTDSVVEYLNRLPQFEDTVPKTLSDPQPEVAAPADPA